MDLSRNIIKRYVQVASPEKITSNSETVYGTVVNEGETLYVKIDGSNILTPVSSTIDIKANDRVLVLVKNHEATVIGSPSSPTARLEELTKLGGKVTKLDTVVASKVGADELVAIQASIDNLNTNKLSVNDAELKYATIEKLDAENANINGQLNAHNASIDNLTTKVFDTETGKVKFADIDFANIGDAAVENFYAASGIIQNLTLETGVVVKELVGVKIKGDLIEGNTIQADKLIVRGEDGLYYKLNVDALGETTASADSKYQNGLDGSVIIAKSITAEKVSVSDLVAFGATIGGFHITTNSIYSGTKESATNTTRGLYLDNDGQIVLGDENNYLKFYKTDETNYAFEISLVDAVQENINANAANMESLPKKEDLDDLQNQITDQESKISELTNTTNALGSSISDNSEQVDKLGEDLNRYS